MRDPGLYWNQAPLEIKKRVQDSIFPEGLVYDPAEGFGAAKLDLRKIRNTKCVSGVSP